MDDIYQKYEAALREIDRLRKENCQLKLQIRERIEGEVSAEHSAYLPKVSDDDDQINQYSTVEKKLALYRSYFRGRDDVYPIRWQNKQGNRDIRLSAETSGVECVTNQRSNVWHVRIRNFCRYPMMFYLNT